MRRLSALLVTAIIFIAGCAVTPRMPEALDSGHCTCQPLHLNGIRRIAVLELKNLTGSREANEKIMGPFIAGLMNTHRFELMERSQIDKVIQELELAQSGLVDTKAAKEAGNLLGADAVIVGEITNFQAEVKPFEYKYSRDHANMLNLPPGDKTQAIVGVPAETRTYTVDKYYASLGFSLRMIAVDSGEVIWSRHVSRSFGMREGEYEIRNIYTLLDLLVAAAVKEAICDFL
jgi:PBP1b-binding outer membrane lipoprotein LpoB